MDKIEKKVQSPKLMISVLMAATFVGLFGETALNMALTNLMDQFAISTATAQWLVTGYLLTLAIFVPISTFLVRWINTRHLILAAISISLLGCIIAAFATNFPLLLIGRIIQAIGTGIILPVLMNVALLIFPISQRGAVMGAIGLAITLAPACGPTLSGFIITSLSWHYIFWISALLYIGIYIVGYKTVEHVGDLTRPHIDIVSLILSTLGFSGIIYALAVLSEHRFYSFAVLGSLAIGIISLLLFGFRQKRMLAPMISLDVFKHRLFVVGLFLMIISIMCVLSAAIILPIYLKSILLFTAALAGILLLPGNAVNVIFSPIIGLLFNRFDARLFVVIGSLFMLVSSIIFLNITNTNGQAAIIIVIVAFMCLCMGVTCVIMPAQTTALNDLPKALYADGSAVWNTLYQVAGAIGTSVSVTLMTYFQQQYQNNDTLDHEITSLVFGIHNVFYFIFILSIVSLILSFMLKKRFKLLRN